MQAHDDHEYKRVQVEVQEERKGADWELVDGLVAKDRRVFVPASLPIVVVLLERAHDAGHEGISRTLHRLRSDFHILGDKALV